MNYMEEEASINFKALRAKFQEEALMAESRASRAAVAGKPRHFPAPGGHCSSVLSSLHMAVEHKAPVVPRVFFRDELRSSGGKRPISFPPFAHQSPPPQPAECDAPSRHLFKDRHMPLVLPVLPEQRVRKDNQVEALDLLQGKTKKKSMHLPFKSTRFAKASSEIGEEPTYADLTYRPASAPGELQSVERQITDDRASLQGSENMNESTFSSLDITISPPTAEHHPDAERGVLSTLEKAKKKFSCRPVMSIRPKCSSPERGSKSKSTHSNDLTASPPKPAPPLSLPNFIYISARPFSKSSTSLKSPLEKSFNRDKANRPFARIGEPHPPYPQKKFLPDLWVLGPQPKKPPRPPVVDLSFYKAQISQEKTPLDVSLGLHHAAPSPDNTESTPVIEAPEFPDFEASEIRPTETECVDIIALDLEALDLPAPELEAPLHCAEPHPDWADQTLNCEQKEVDLGNPNENPPDPPSFPEPINLSEFPQPIEQWSQSEEANVEPSSSTEQTAEVSSMTENTEQGEQANNFEFGIYQQEILPAPCDNVYEDVENLCKPVSQNSRKWKGLKNPYADTIQLKEESAHHKWQRSSRVCNGGDSGYLSHSQINSKECPSPNTADAKEQKKREKQRLDKEKKEQKEREKKENEMRKKFKVTGAEEPLYHAKVTVASKLRKHDLPVKSGDTVCIIRTTNCPKGKWLARDANHKYGYISVMNVELNIKEMLELGKKAQATGKANMEPDSISIGSSNHPVMTSSFTDDSEEWACEDETVSASESLIFPQQPARLPEISGGHVGAQHTLSDASLEDLHTQTRHEALQKLAIFFQHNKEETNDKCIEAALSLQTPNLCDVEEPPLPVQEMDFAEMELLPPPPLYADIF